MPIPLFNSGIRKPTISFYFEVEILNGYFYIRYYIIYFHTLFSDSILIGFCDKHFPLEGKELGKKNTIGIFGKFAQEERLFLFKQNMADGFTNYNSKIATDF